MIESWRRHSTSVRPHASLGYRLPAPELFVPAFAAWPAALTRPAPPARLPVVKRPTLMEWMPPPGDSASYRVAIGHSITGGEGLHGSGNHHRN